MDYSGYRRLFSATPYAAPPSVSGQPAPHRRPDDTMGQVGAATQVADLFAGQTGPKTIGDESYAYKPISEQPGGEMVPWLKEPNIAKPPELQEADLRELNGPMRDYNSYREDPYWASVYPNAGQFAGKPVESPADDTASNLAAVSAIASIFGGG